MRVQIRQDEERRFGGRQHLVWMPAIGVIEKIKGIFLGF
jgi:hypothetical protein